MTREEERALALRARAGDVAAKHRLVQSALRFVLRAARKQRRPGVQLDDLVQEAGLALMRAAERFDPDAGVRFLSYAGPGIARAMWRLQRAASIVKRTGVRTMADVSLDAPVEDEEGSATHVDRLPDGGPSPEERVVEADTRHAVRRQLRLVERQLGARGRDVVERLAADDEDTPSLADLGERWGVTRERARQIEAEVVPFLRRRLAPCNRGEAEEETG